MEKLTVNRIVNYGDNETNHIVGVVLAELDVTFQVFNGVLSMQTGNNMNSTIIFSLLRGNNHVTEDKLKNIWLQIDKHFPHHTGKVTRDETRTYLTIKD